MPNGEIIAYEVSYRRTASSQSETRDNTTALVWAPENNLEEDTEFIFSLRAYTRVGPGNYSSLTLTTLSGDQSSMTRKTQKRRLYFLPCFLILGAPNRTLYYYVAIPSAATVAALVCIIIIIAYIRR